MSNDPFVHFDGAYVLGALSPAEREAFEEHLLTCAACAARVDELAELPALLDTLTEADVVAAGQSEALPDTLLPRLMRAVEGRRRRSRIVLGGLAAVAAACVAALVVVLWPTSSTTSGGTAQAMRAVVADPPVHATVRLVSKTWGTEIDMKCGYSESQTERSLPYLLVVTGRDGQQQTVGTWSLSPGENAEFHTPTSIAVDDIAKLELEIPGNRTILELDR
jgi:anti-sigma-K factor RskA